MQREDTGGCLIDCAQKAGQALYHSGLYDNKKLWQKTKVILLHVSNSKVFW